MRVGIIAANNIRYSPYIFFYTELLKENHIDFELIIPDRNKLQDSFDGTLHILPWDPNKKTAVNYALYARGVTQIINQQAYDALIVLTSVNAAYLSLWLKKHYPGRYIVDIRDYTHENIYPYFLMQSLAVRHSLMNVISSRKFISFLPKAKYYVCHNFNKDDVTTVHAHCQTTTSNIIIGYVGALSYVSQCQALMQLVAQDPRFSLEFYGSSPDEQQLRDYAKTLSCRTIHFHGAYIPADKGRIIENVDILFNAYGNGIPLLDCALSNKLYDSLIYRKPILTSPNTFMAEMAGPLAFSIDLPKEKSLDSLYNWYTSLVPEQLELFADQALDQIISEHTLTLRAIADKLQSISGSSGSNMK